MGEIATLSQEVTARTNAILARSAIWRLLSQAFAYPRPETVAQLREEDLPLALAVSEPLAAPVRQALDGLAEALEGAEDGALEETYRDVLSHIHSQDCPMFETDFSSSEVWRRTQELADIAGFYRAFGVEHPRERPDHVSVETEFLHLVTYKSAWALVQGDVEHAEICEAAERRFLAEHVFKWMPAFASRFRALMPEGPYRAVGALAQELLRSEAGRIDVCMDDSVEPSPVDPEAQALAEAGLCEQEEAEDR
jgi:nitrate reductase assembly molybdenum cofactor insertion protein NarJ